MVSGRLCALFKGFWGGVWEPTLHPKSVDFMLFWSPHGAQRVPKGSLFVHFGGPGMSLASFGAQSAPGTPSLRSRRPILSDFGPQMKPKRAPKGSRNRSKTNPKIDAKFSSTFYRFWERFWWIFGAKMGAFGRYLLGLFAAWPNIEK